MTINFDIIESGGEDLKRDKGERKGKGMRKRRD